MLYGSNPIDYTFYVKQTAFLQTVAVDFPRFEPLVVDEKYSAHYDLIFNKDYILRAHPQTDDELYEVILKNFTNHKAALAKAWSVTNPDVLLSLYLMNTTSALWGFGNKAKINETGCVYQNENTGGRSVVNPDAPIEQHIPLYLKSNIGCCVDYSNMLSLLLNKAGIKNRILKNPGHVLNEAFIDNKWQALDATVNFWWHDSWSVIQNSGIQSSIYVSIFPHYGTRIAHEFYRPFIGQFRNYMQLEGIYKLAKEITYIYPTHQNLFSQK